MNATLTKKGWKSINSFFFFLKKLKMKINKDYFKKTKLTFQLKICSVIFSILSLLHQQLYSISFSSLFFFSINNFFFFFWGKIKNCSFQFFQLRKQICAPSHQLYTSSDRNRLVEKSTQPFFLNEKLIYYLRKLIYNPFFF